jgi:hypothetical protein
MDSAAPRPFRLGCFDVRNGAVLAADESLPIAVEIDASTGETVRVFSWPLSENHRGRPAACWSWSSAPTQADTKLGGPNADPVGGRDAHEIIRNHGSAPPMAQPTRDQLLTALEPAA